jgi:uracil-DNA glycosylase
MPNKQLTLLIGSYAQQYYLKQRSTEKLTDTVRNYERYLPEYFPLVHPSPRNNIWQSKNPWFLEQVIPDLQEHVKEILE